MRFCFAFFGLDERYGDVTTVDYTVICDHYCGIGHGGMKMKITVV